MHQTYAALIIITSSTRITIYELPNIIVRIEIVDVISEMASFPFFNNREIPSASDARTRWIMGLLLYPSLRYQTFVNRSVRTRDAHIIHTSHTAFLPLEQSLWGNDMASFQLNIRYYSFIPEND